MVLSGAMGGLGYRSQSLSRSGVLGAILIGTIIFGAGGWIWGLTLIAFFASSNVMSRYRAAEKATYAAAFAKDGRRDLGQALANGGWGAALALAFITHPSPLLIAAFVGAVATVNADTWATELGLLSKDLPRRITTGETVMPGTSGSITVLGTMASVAGALFIGLTAEGLYVLTAWRSGQPVVQWTTWLPLAAGVGGLAGAFFDSLLGATVQRTFWCDWCQTETERPVHTCGMSSRYLRGWQWLGNDAVNFLASMVGSGVTAGLVWLLFQMRG